MLKATFTLKHVHNWTKIRQNLHLVGNYKTCRQYRLFVKLMYREFNYYFVSYDVFFSVYNKNIIWRCKNNLKNEINNFIIYEQKMVFMWCFRESHYTKSINMEYISIYIYSCTTKKIAFTFLLRNDTNKRTDVSFLRKRYSDHLHFKSYLSVEEILILAFGVSVTRDFPIWTR